MGGEWICGKPSYIRTQNIQHLLSSYGVPGCMLDTRVLRLTGHHDCPWGTSFGFALPVESALREMPASRDTGRAGVWTWLLCQLPLWCFMGWWKGYVVSLKLAPTPPGPTPRVWHSTQAWRLSHQGCLVSHYFFSISLFLISFFFFFFFHPQVRRTSLS